MDRNSMVFAPAIFALALSASVYAGEQPVKVNVSHLQPSPSPLPPIARKTYEAT